MLHGRGMIVAVYVILRISTVGLMGIVFVSVDVNVKIEILDIACRKRDRGIVTETGISKRHHSTGGIMSDVLRYDVFTTLVR